jgi:hypothetical protein
MRKLLVALLGAAVAATPMVIVVGPAAADTPGCVTRAEYRAVKHGMTKTKVHGIFDTRGNRQAIASSGRYTVEIRSYKTCSRFSAVAVSYQNGRLSTKSAVWVG